MEILIYALTKVVIAGIAACYCRMSIDGCVKFGVWRCPICIILGYKSVPLPRVNLRISAVDRWKAALGILYGVSVVLPISH